MKYCKICHLHVRDDEESSKEVTGWVGGRKKDSMRLRQDTGAIAHTECVSIMAAGQDPTQPDLFTDDICIHPEGRRFLNKQGSTICEDCGVLITTVDMDLEGLL